MKKINQTANTENTDDNLAVFNADWLPIKTFCKVYGKKESTVRSWISRKILLLNDTYCYDPLGHVHLSITGWEKWVTTNIQKGYVSTTENYRSSLNQKGIKTTSIKQSVATYQKIK